MTKPTLADVRKILGDIHSEFFLNQRCCCGNEYGYTCDVADSIVALAAHEAREVVAWGCVSRKHVDRNWLIDARNWQEAEAQQQHDKRTPCRVPVRALYAD